MAYSINFSNPSLPAIIVNDNGIDTSSTSLTFVGRGRINYGEVLQENMLHLMEHFANTTPPPNMVLGQAWFDTQNDVLKINKASGLDSLVTGSELADSGFDAQLEMLAVS